MPKAAYSFKYFMYLNFQKLQFFTTAIMGRTSKLQLSISQVIKIYSSNSDLTSFQVTNKAIYYSFFFFFPTLCVLFIFKEWAIYLYFQRLTRYPPAPQSYPRTLYLQSQNNFWRAGLQVISRYVVNLSSNIWLSLHFHKHISWHQEEQHSSFLSPSISRSIGKDLKLAMKFTSQRRKTMISIIFTRLFLHVNPMA